MRFANSEFQKPANSIHTSNLFARISIVHSTNEIGLLLIARVALSLCFLKLFSDWLLSIRDNGLHANVRKKSNIANRSKSHCERSHAICEGSLANFKQRIACDLRIAIEVEMGLKTFISGLPFI